jgi:hypothetical protein
LVGFNCQLLLRQGANGKDELSYYIHDVLTSHWQ